MNKKMDPNRARTQRRIARTNPEDLVCEGLENVNPDHVRLISEWLRRHPEAQENLFKRLDDFFGEYFNRVLYVFSDLKRQDQSIFDNHNAASYSIIIISLKDDYFYRASGYQRKSVYKYLSHDVPQRIGEFDASNMNSLFHHYTRQIVQYRDVLYINDTTGRQLFEYRETADELITALQSSDIVSNQVFLFPDETHLLWQVDYVNEDGETENVLLVYRIDTEDQATYTVTKLKHLHSPQPLGHIENVLIDQRNRLYISSEPSLGLYRVSVYDLQSDTWHVFDSDRFFFFKMSDDNRYLLGWTQRAPHITTLTDTQTDQRLTLPWNYNSDFLLSPDFKFFLDQQPDGTILVRDILQGNEIHRFQLPEHCRLFMITSDYHVLYDLDLDPHTTVGELRTYAHSIFPQQSFEDSTRLTNKALQSIQVLQRMWKTPLCEVDATLCLGCVNTPMQNITVQETVMAGTFIPSEDNDALAHLRIIFDQLKKWCVDLRDPLRSIREHDTREVGNYAQSLYQDEKERTYQPTSLMSGPPEMNTGVGWQPWTASLQQPVPAPVVEEKQPAPATSGYDWGRMATPVPYYRGPPGPETAAINRELMKDQPDVAAIAALLDQQGVVGLDTTPQALAQQLVDHRPNPNKRRRE